MTKNTKRPEIAKYYRILYDATDAVGTPYRPNAEMITPAVSIEQAIRILRRTMQIDCKHRRGLDGIVEIRLIERVTKAAFGEFQVDVLRARAHSSDQTPRPSSTLEYEDRLRKIRRQRKLKTLKRAK
jgi:hypothetical protein